MMETKKYKRLPYGNSDFRDMILNNYAYVDKTRFIAELERESNRNHFFIRPRKFGKSLFFKMLNYYYNINYKNEFEQLFGNLYIGRHPTPERNSYAVMEFDFSGLSTGSEESFMKSFSNKVQDSVREFLDINDNIIPDAQHLIRMIDEERPGIDALTKAFATVSKHGIKIYLIIDE
ncbi:MAG: AAA family ATPase, partial [Tannerella sp.]|nr:AAA family ATPase [Tannerella sp.]